MEEEKEEATAATAAAAAGPTRASEDGMLARRSEREARRVGHGRGRWRWWPALAAPEDEGNVAAAAAGGAGEVGRRRAGKHQAEAEAAAAAAREAVVERGGQPDWEKRRKGDVDVGWGWGKGGFSVEKLSREGGGPRGALSLGGWGPPPGEGLRGARGWLGESNVYGAGWR